MEDYIFLLIAIGLSIFGAINQNKKKKEASLNPTGKADKPGNFFLDQLLGSDFLSEPKEMEKPVPLMKPALKKETLVNPMPGKQSGLYHTSFTSTLPDRAKKPLQPTLRKPVDDTMANEPEEEEMAGYLEGFSLRKAFVYSEIMQRKY
jgi:hypothetical protein